MIFDKKTINTISDLSKIAIDENETAKYINECSKIVEFIQAIQSVETNDIAPLHHPLDDTQRLREDVVKEVNNRETHEALSTHIESHFYAVPKVIE